jgi:exonuclease III
MLLTTLRNDTHLCNKFLDNQANCPNAQISFDTMDSLLQKGALQDIGYLSRMASDGPFVGTVPTNSNDDASHAAPMRLDYILATPILTKAGVFGNSSVIQNEQTQFISDHFPIIANWNLCPQQVSARKRRGARQHDNSITT